MRFETEKSRTHLGQRGHDVSEAAGLGEGRALRADEHDVESLIGVDGERAAPARGGRARRGGARGAPEGGEDGAATDRGRGRARGERVGGHVEVGCAGERSAWGNDGNAERKSSTTS